jgi:hypothetical protein
MYGNVVWLDFATPQEHMPNGCGRTVTSARIISNVPAVEAALRLLGSLAFEGQQAKLDVDIRTLSSLDTPSI